MYTEVNIHHQGVIVVDGKGGYVRWRDALVPVFNFLAWHARFRCLGVC
jgi:hypothetical protein